MREELNYPGKTKRTTKVHKKMRDHVNDLAGITREVLKDEGGLERLRNHTWMEGLVL